MVTAWEGQLTGREWKQLANLIVIADKVHSQWRSEHGMELTSVAFDGAMWELESRLGDLSDRIRERIYGDDTARTALGAHGEGE